MELKSTLKQIAYFIALFLSIIGLFGGIGYLFYYHQGFIAICLIVVGVMAFPTAKKLFKSLLNGEE